MRYNKKILFSVLFLILVLIFVYNIKNTENFGGRKKRAREFKKKIRDGRRDQAISHVLHLRAGDEVSDDVMNAYRRQQQIAPPERVFGYLVEEKSKEEKNFNKAMADLKGTRTVDDQQGFFSFFGRRKREATLDESLDNKITALRNSRNRLSESRRRIQVLSERVPYLKAGNSSSVVDEYQRAQNLDILSRSG